MLLYEHKGGKNAVNFMPSTGSTKCQHIYAFAVLCVVYIVSDYSDMKFCDALYF